MTYGCVRESMKARDIGMTCRNIHVIAQCVYKC